MTKQLATQTEDLYRSIGSVVVEFQFVESVLAEVLASLLKLRNQDDQHRLGAAMSFRQKVDLTCDLYPLRKGENWPQVEIADVRKALYAAEEFRNSVVHSYWYVGGDAAITWMRSKSTIRSSNGLKITVGPASITSMRSGAQATHVVRDWYLGETNALRSATKVLKATTLALSSAHGDA